MTSNSNEKDVVYFFGNLTFLLSDAFAILVKLLAWIREYEKTRQTVCTPII